MVQRAAPEEPLGHTARRDNIRNGENHKLGGGARVDYHSDAWNPATS
jgi:hypothetical protein